MTVDYSRYLPKSRMSISRVGRELQRELYILAESEIAALYHEDCPQIGEAVDIGDGSISDYIYCADVRITQVEQADAANGYVYHVLASYQRISANNPVANKATWRVSFRPVQINLRNVKTTADQTRYGPSLGNPPKWPEIKTGINVTAEGPQGVDVDIMAETLQLEFFKPESAATDYISGVRAIVGKVNNAAFTGPWGTYAKGEARITGLEVSRLNNYLVGVSVEISRLPNETTNVYLDSTGGTVEISKEGWQYLWVRFIRYYSSANGDVRPQAIDAYVATIYEYGDYSALGVSGGIWL